MGHPDGAHTHGSGGSGLGPVVAVVLAAAVVASVAGPVINAVTELLRLVLIVLAVVAGVGALGLVGLVAWRLRQGRANGTTPVSFQPPILQRPAQALPARQQAALPARDVPAIERPAELHLHFHGLRAEEAAAIVRQAHLYGTRNEHPAIEED